MRVVEQDPVPIPAEVDEQIDEAPGNPLANHDRAVEPGGLGQHQPGGHVEHPVAEAAVGGGGHQQGGGVEDLHRIDAVAERRRVADEALPGPPETGLGRVARRPHLHRHLALAIEHEASADQGPALQGGDELGSDVVGEAGRLGSGGGQGNERLQRHGPAAAVQIEDAVAARLQGPGIIDLEEGLARRPHHDRLQGIEGKPPGAQPNRHGRGDRILEAGGRAAPGLAECLGRLGLAQGMMRAARPPASRIRSPRPWRFG